MLGRRRLVSHRRPGRARCRRQPLFQGPQEERHRDPRRDEHLSRRPGGGAAPAAGGARLRRGGTGAGRQCRTRCCTLAARCCSRCCSNCCTGQPATWRSFSRCDAGWFGPSEDFPRTPTQKPKVGVIQQAVQQKFSSAGAAAPAQGGLGRTHQPNHRTQHRRACARRQAGRRSEPEFHGPRGADERAGRPLPGGLERGELCAGQHRR